MGASRLVLHTLFIAQFAGCDRISLDQLSWSDLSQDHKKLSLGTPPFELGLLVARVGPRTLVETTFREYTVCCILGGRTLSIPQGPSDSPSFYKVLLRSPDIGPALQAKTIKEGLRSVISPRASSGFIRFRSYPSSNAICSARPWRFPRSVITKGFAMR